jgi:hypothetical protein
LAMLPNHELMVQLSVWKFEFTFEQAQEALNIWLHSKVMRLFFLLLDMSLLDSYFHKRLI